MRLSTKPFFNFLITLIAVWALSGFECRAWAEDTTENFINTTPEKVAQLARLHEQAEVLVAEDRYREAVDVYLEIILVEPDDEAAYANLGHAYMILGDFARAKDAFQNALHINSQNEIALLGLQKISDPDSTLYGGASS